MVILFLPIPRRLSGRIFGDSPATDKNSACIRGTPEGSVFFYFLKMNNCVSQYPFSKPTYFWPNDWRKQSLSFYFCSCSWKNTNTCVNAYCMQICCVFPRTVHKAEFIYTHKIKTWKVFVRGMTYVGNEPQNMHKRKDDGLTTCIFLQQFPSEVGFRPCHAKVNCTRICTAGRVAGVPLTSACSTCQREKV